MQPLSIASFTSFKAVKYFELFDYSVDSAVSTLRDDDEVAVSLSSVSGFAQHPYHSDLVAISGGYNITLVSMQTGTKIRSFLTSKYGVVNTIAWLCPLKVCVDVSVNDDAPVKVINPFFTENYILFTTKNTPEKRGDYALQLLDVYSGAVSTISFQESIHDVKTPWHVVNTSLVVHDLVWSDTTLHTILSKQKFSTPELGLPYMYALVVFESALTVVSVAPRSLQASEATLSYSLTNIPIGRSLFGRRLSCCFSNFPNVIYVQTGDQLLQIKLIMKDFSKILLETESASAKATAYKEALYRRYIDTVSDVDNTLLNLCKHCFVSENMFNAFTGAKIEQTISLATVFKCSHNPSAASMVQQSNIFIKSMLSIGQPFSKYFDKAGNYKFDLFSESNFALSLLHVVRLVPSRDGRYILIVCTECVVVFAPGINAVAAILLYPSGGAASKSPILVSLKFKLPQSDVQQLQGIGGADGKSSGTATKDAYESINSDYHISDENYDDVDIFGDVSNVQIGKVNFTDAPANEPVTEPQRESVTESSFYVEPDQEASVADSLLESSFLDDVNILRTVQHGDQHTGAGSGAGTISGVQPTSFDASKDASSTNPFIYFLNESMITLADMDKPTSLSDFLKKHGEFFATFLYIYKENMTYHKLSQMGFNMREYVSFATEQTVTFTPDENFVILSSVNGLGSPVLWNITNLDSKVGDGGNVTCIMGTFWTNQYLEEGSFSLRNVLFFGDDNAVCMLSNGTMLLAMTP